MLIESLVDLKPKPSGEPLVDTLFEERELLPPSLPARLLTTLAPMLLPSGDTLKQQTASQPTTFRDFAWRLAQEKHEQLERLSAAEGSVDKHQHRHAFSSSLLLLPLPLPTHTGSSCARHISCARAIKPSTP